MPASIEFEKAFAHHIGLEFDDHVVRYAALRRRGSSPGLSTYGSAPLPNGAIVNGEIIKPDVVVATFRRAAAAPLGHHVTERYAVTAIPEIHVFTTVIEVPTNRKNDSDAIVNEALQHIPYTAEEVEIRYRILEPFDHRTTVLVGAIPHTIIDQYTKLVHACGFVPIALEPESCAIGRAVIAGDLSARSLICVDFGSTLTTILAIYRGTVYFSSSSAQFSGNDLTRLIGDKLSLSPAQAEKAKRLFGLNPKQGKGEVRRALLGAFTEFSRRLVEVEDFAAEHLPVPAQRATGVVLTGGGSVLPGLSEFLGAELRLPILTPLPFGQYAIKTGKNVMPEDDQRSFTTTFGLALNNL